MKNVLRTSTIALALLGSVSIASAQSPGPAGPATANCVEVGTNGIACAKVIGKEYTVGPRGAPSATSPVLNYSACEARDPGEFECFAPGIRSGRLFVHRKNGQLFASLQPKAN